MARRMTLFCLAVVVALPLAAFADWDPGMPCKWVQFPDLGSTGIDVNASGQFILADDFLCSHPGPITDIHIWGSWLNDFRSEAFFTLSIHADIPAGPEGGYSMPGDVLWYRTFQPGEYAVRVWEQGINEGWMDPPDVYTFPADHVCWQYNFYIPEDEAFYQRGTPDEPITYWLDVRVEPMEPGTSLFGWKTSLDHWNDDAVWGMGLEPYFGPWSELIYPPMHEMAGQSIDLAFVITTQLTDEIDWGDAPDSPAAPGYPTLASNNGANHAIVSGAPWLGDASDGPDSEPDGQPDPAALGDDNDGNDDEDGVQIPVMVLGKTSTITYEISGSAGCVDAWIDFNGDRIWQDPAERILSTVPQGPGIFSFAVTPPAGSIVGPTFARFRISTAGGLPPTGGAPDGEVEDYRVTILEPHKWLQAPDLSPMGIDVNATYPYSILADDFLCAEPGRIVEIKIWGSWLNDWLPFGTDPTAVDFVLSLHSDIPVGPNGYSEPGEPLWWDIFSAGDYSVEVWRDQIEEGWMDPPDAYWFPADWTCWLYTFYVRADKAFFQSGTEANPIVYWLDLQAYPWDPDAFFGWKTSVDHWNDDAVWGYGYEPCYGPWGELRYPPQHQYYPYSIDLAFALRTDPTSGTPVEDLGEIWLYQNQPNPFESSTTITFEMPSAGGNVRLDVFDVSGRLVSTLVDGMQAGGVHSVEWNGRDANGRELASGVYFYRLTAGQRELDRKMMFIR
jgi:hypothetical protein